MLTHARLVPAVVLACIVTVPLRGQSPPTWSLTRDVSIGTSGAGRITQPEAVTVGPNGEVIVFDYASQTINRYSPTGPFTAALSVPRQCTLAGIGFVGDTLWASDATRRTLMLFRPARAEPEVYPLSYDPHVDGLAPAAPRLVLRGGSVVAQAGGDGLGSLSLVGRNDHLASPIVALRRDGTVADTLATPLHGMNKVISVSERTDRVSPTGSPISRYMASAQPFQAHAFFGGPSDGSGVVVVDAPIHTSGAAAFTIERFDASGRRVGVRRYAYEPVPITQPAIDSALSGWVARMGPAAVESARAQLVTPAYRPPVTQLLVGRDGSVWLRREPEPAGDRRWTVIDATGTVVAEVSAPRGRMVYADLSQVLVVERVGESTTLIRYRVRR
jgi:hypothetical protein